MRYRLSTLLVAMVWVGLVCLALRSPNYWWSGGMFALLVLVLLTSVLVAIYRTGQLRAMAIGFFVFSAGYLVVEGNYWPGGAAGLGLPTDRLVRWSFDLLHGPETGVIQDEPLIVRLGNSEQFQAYRAICISSLAIVGGIIGGIIAQALCHTQPGDRKPPANLSG